VACISLWDRNGVTWAGKKSRELLHYQGKSCVALSWIGRLEVGGQRGLMASGEAGLPSELLVDREDLAKHLRPALFIQLKIPMLNPIWNESSIFYPVYVFWNARLPGKTHHLLKSSRLVSPKPWLFHLFVFNETFLFSNKISTKVGYMP